jgi:hypothetical protein
MENAARYIKDDKTTVIRMNCLPSLEYIEKLVKNYPGVEIAFYNPGADIREPWLWLQTDTKVHRYYESPKGNQLERTIKELFHRAQGGMINP